MDRLSNSDEMHYTLLGMMFHIYNVGISFDSAFMDNCIGHAVDAGPTNVSSSYFSRGLKNLRDDGVVD